MKKLTQFVFGKWYGVTLTWLAWGAAVLAYCLIAGPYWSLGYLTTAVIVSHLLGALGLLCVVVHSLLKRRWRRAVAQLLLWVLAVVSYGAGLRAVAVAVTNSGRYMNDFDRTQEPWYGTKPCETVPFGVEFRHGHPYLAEYDRRVVFKSGGRRTQGQAISRPHHDAGRTRLGRKLSVGSHGRVVRVIRTDSRERHNKDYRNAGN